MTNSPHSSQHLLEVAMNVIVQSMVLTVAALAVIRFVWLLLEDDK